MPYHIVIRTESTMARLLTERVETEMPGCMIPPETFPVEIVRDSIPVPSQSAEPEPLGLPGNDFSEIYSLRGYEPGDDVKRIHWKLTEKTDEVLVREGSRPQEDEVLLYWD